MLRSLEQNSGFTVHERDSFYESKEGLDVESICQSEEAVNLVSCVCRMEDAVLDSFASLEPLNMTTYLFELSHCISKGLKVLPIKHESNRGSALTRLSLFSCAKTALATGMQILGLQPLRAM